MTVFDDPLDPLFDFSEFVLAPLRASLADPSGRDDASLVAVRTEAQLANLSVEVDQLKRAIGEAAAA